MVNAITPSFIINTIMMLLRAATVMGNSGEKREVKERSEKKFFTFHNVLVINATTGSTESVSASGAATAATLGWGSAHRQDRQTGS